MDEKFRTYIESARGGLSKKLSSTPEQRLGSLFNCRTVQSNPACRMRGEENCAITKLVKAIVQLILADYCNLRKRRAYGSKNIFSRR